MTIVPETGCSSKGRACFRAPDPRAPDPRARSHPASAGHCVAPGQSHPTDGRNSGTKLLATEFQLATETVTETENEQGDVSAQ